VIFPANMNNITYAAPTIAAMRAPHL